MSGYDIVYENEKFWISKDGEILEDLGGFIEPVSPKIIIKEIEENGEI